MLSKRFMAVCILSATIALAFASMVLVTVDNDVGQSLNWAVSDSYSFGGVSFMFYVNIFSYERDIITDDDNVTVIKFTDSDCTDSYCSDCASGNRVVLAFAILFLFFCLPGMYSNVMRACNGNTSTNKAIGTLSATAACTCGSISLIVFSAKCMQKIADTITNVDWYYGAAYGLLAAGVAMKFVDCLFNSIIDTDAAAQGLLDGALIQ